MTPMPLITSSAPALGGEAGRHAKPLPASTLRAAPGRCALEHDLQLRQQGLPHLVWRIPRIQINLAQGGNGALFADDGHWAGPEPWGQWTAAQQATLSFLVGAPRDLGFAAHQSALCCPPRLPSSQRGSRRTGVGSAASNWTWRMMPGLRLYRESSLPVAWMLTEGSSCVSIPIELRSPKEIGINDDARKLGVGVEHVVIRELNIAGRQ